MSSSSSDATGARTVPWAAELTAEVERVKRRFSGRVSLHIRDPHRGSSYGYDAEKPSYLASGVKVAFMIEVFRQIEAGELSMDDKVTYGPEDIRDGAPVVNPRPIGTLFTIRELLVAMIQSSDNAASDMLVRRVGLDRVNGTLKALGYEGFAPIVRLIDVRRAVFRELDVRGDDLTPLEIRTIRWTPIWEPQVAVLTAALGRPKGTFTKRDLQEAFERFYATGVNTARLDSMSRIYEDMLAGRLVSAQASREMLELLGAVKTSTRRILGRLPKGTHVAHKTGSQYERICDLGVVWLPDQQPLIFCACLAGGNDRNAAEDRLAELARKAFDLAVVDHARKPAN